MAESRDFNDILDDIVLSEDAQEKESYKEGFQAGVETGYYMRIVVHHLELNDTLDPKYSDKIIKQLQKVKDLIDEFPRTNSEDHDILKMAETIRGQFRKASSLLKISSNIPYDAGVSF
ncbi:uncharacterized protein LOC123713800 isoform X1 [Pieris brassicae]|uniref:uncharacterized protein LOC123713800 isoform X1 n=1 Tax=Pieris brassicae TaxID=7116 RepID=UPI001E6603DE|nr:uncharacterized protein LOC123713800 isoform X1 [Pieris brassicae]